MDVLPPSEPDAAADSFVQVDGTRFHVDGETYRFIGFNLFDAAGTPNGYHCAWWPAYTDAELDEALRYMRREAGATVLRFWAFQSYTRGGTDWGGIDRVIRLARRNGLRVIPVLENGSQHCTQGGTKWSDGGSWYSQAHQRDFRYGYPLSFPDYVERIVTLYKDEPAILAWMVMNEAETENVPGMHSFAHEMTSLIKRLDPNHLVTLGTQASGQPGARGPDFLAVYGLPTIDFVEGHDYDYWGEDHNPLPGSIDGRSLPDPETCHNFRAIACSMAQTLHILKKPFVVGEAGMRAKMPGDGDRVPDGYTRDVRARLLDDKITAAFENGVSGYLIWQWNRIVDVGYDVLPGDPLLQVLHRHASGLRRRTSLFEP